MILLIIDLEMRSCISKNWWKHFIEHDEYNMRRACKVKKFKEIENKMFDFIEIIIINLEKIMDYLSWRLVIDCEPLKKNDEIRRRFQACERVE